MWHVACVLCIACSLIYSINIACTHIPRACRCASRADVDARMHTKPAPRVRACAHTHTPHSPPDKRPRMDGGSSDDSKKKGQVEVVLSAKDKRKAEAAAKKVARARARKTDRARVRAQGESVCAPARVMSRKRRARMRKREGAGERGGVRRYAHM